MILDHSPSYMRVSISSKRGYGDALHLPDSRQHEYSNDLLVASTTIDLAIIHSNHAGGSRCSDDEYNGEVIRLPIR